MTKLGDRGKLVLARHSDKVGDGLQWICPGLVDTSGLAAMRQHSRLLGGS